MCVFFSFFISWLCFLPWTKVSFFCTSSPLVYSSITFLFILPSLSLFLLLYLCLCIVSAQKYQHHPFTLPMTLKTIYIARHGYRSNWLPLPEQIPHQQVSTAIHHLHHTVSNRRRNLLGLSRRTSRKKSARASDDLLISVLQMYRNYQPHC